MLDKKAKDRIIKKYRTHDSDTGSSQVQIAILTTEIKELTGHLKTHRKDHSSRRGLLKKVGERRRLLRYLEHEDPKGFEELVKQLKLKIAKRYDQKTIEAAEAAHVAELEAAEEAAEVGEDDLDDEA
ncbi:MAG: 30S ribosomal protein S15 [Patescibacteria group bacterium]|jgi:small subunit ribosomal protein S15